MSQSESRQQDEATTRAAAMLAAAMAELHDSAAYQATQELQASRASLEQLASGVERTLAEEREQHVALAGQLTSLAGSLDRLVVHLQGLSQLMADLLERLSGPQAESAPAATVAEQPEPAFQPGGEGLTLALTDVPGFQALMDIQKALAGLDQVARASVERFQEGDSRILVHLAAPITSTQLVDALIRATGQSLAVEESRPELSRLTLKVVPGMG